MNFNSVSRLSKWGLGVLAGSFLCGTSFAQLVQSQATPITIRDNASADPYPSQITISGAVGKVQSVSVKLNKISHNYAGDIDVLLVGPNNRGVLLMSDTGGDVPLSGVDLTFSDAASGSLPAAGAIASGTFKPSNYEAVSDFADVTGVTLFPTLEAAFKDVTGTGLNAAWRLYVRDDQAVDAGSIGSWSLSIETTPVIAIATADQTLSIDEETSKTINVTVNDSSTALTSSSLVIRAVSDNPAVAPNDAISLMPGGTGGTRTLTITPKKDAVGSAKITVTAFDGISASDPIEVMLTVKNVNDAPTVKIVQEAGKPLTTMQGVLSAPFAFEIGDIDTPLANLELSATSADGAIVAPFNVFFEGTGAARTLRFAPTGNAVGSTTLMIFATDKTDPAKPLVSIGAPLNVKIDAAAYPVFANSNAITLAAGASASAASAITVANLSSAGSFAPVGKVTVTLADISSASPETLNFLLAGPRGQKVVLMASAGDAVAVSRQRLTFDQGSANLLPDDGAIVTGTYQPGVFPPGSEMFVSPAPAGPYTYSLDAFKGTDPNGVWTLYAYDDAKLAAEVKGGWVLNIQTAPSFAKIGDKEILEDVPQTFNVSIGDFDAAATGFPKTVAVSSEDTALLDATAIRNGNVVAISLTPKLNQFGATFVNFSVTDANDFVTSERFRVNVVTQNDEPVFLTILPKQQTPAGVPVGPLSFTIEDVDQANLTVTAATDNTKLIPLDNIVLEGSGADRNRTVTVFPVGTQTGIANITLTVSDGFKSTSQTFKVTVDPAAFTTFVGGAIGILDNAKADVYPSTITVGGLVPKIAEVRVGLFDVTHPKLEDLDILLVGPGGQVMLMSDAGGAGSLTSAELIFTDSAAGMIPAGTLSSSGVFDPTNYDTGTDIFPAPAPALSVSATFAEAFNGDNPNGAWSLYVVDDASGPKGGIIAGGWTLSIRTVPRITVPLADVTTAEDEKAMVSLTVGDDQPGVEYAVTVSGPMVKSFVVSGTGSKRTLEITPLDNQSAPAGSTVTVTVSDGVNSDTATFKWIINAVNDSPVVSVIPKQTTPAATALGPIAFTYSDIDSTEAQLTVTVSSSNEGVVKNSPATLQVTKTGTGTGEVRLLPEGIQAGTTLITVTVSDGTSKAGTSIFEVQVTDNGLTFADPAPITILDNAAAATYPSTINVKSKPGTVTRATVILVGLSHPFPDDIDILLVAPGDAKSSVIMSDSGGANAVNNLRLRFSDTAAETLPDSTQLVSGTFRPTKSSDPSQNVSMPAPAPAAPAGGYTASLANLNGATATGDWKLYIRDDTFPDAGTISGGWILILETGPEISDLPAVVSIKENNPVVDIPFTVFDSDTLGKDLTVTAVVTSGGAIIEAPAFAALDTANPNNRTLKIKPVAQQFGQVKINVTVTDGTTSATREIVVNVTEIKDAPVIATKPATPAGTAEDTAIAFDYSVTDIDSTLTLANITVVSTDQNVVKADGITVTGTPGAARVTVTPVPNATGSTIIRFTVTDGTTPVTHELTLNVGQVNDAPTFVKPAADKPVIADVSVPAGGTTGVINFKVADIDSPLRNLTITASSSRPEFVPNANIILGGSEADRTVQVTTIGTTAGSSVITLTLSDGDTTAGVKTSTTSFTVSLTAPTSPGQIFANTAEIDILDRTATASEAAKAALYPSRITVGGLIGPITRLAVTLDGFSHDAPDDVDILLVSPGGAAAKKSLILSDTGGRNAVTNLRLRFDEAGVVMGDDTPLTSGQYRPSNFEGADSFPSPAPAGAQSVSSLAEFIGTNPNGDWELYVVDDTTGQKGKILFGWSLQIQTGPSLIVDSPALPAGIIMNEDATATIQLSINDQTGPAGLDLEISSNNSAVIGSEDVNVAVTGGTAILTVTPKANQSGKGELTIVARRKSDGVTTTSVKVPFDVKPLNDLPALTRLPDREVDEDKELRVQFIVSDPDTDLTKLAVKVESSNEAIIPNANLTINGVKATPFIEGLKSSLVELLIKPKEGVNSGTATLTVTIADRAVAGPGNETVSTFNVTVINVNNKPAIAMVTTPIPAIPSGQSRTLTFKVSDTDSATLSVTKKSSNQTLVKDANIVVSPLSGGAGDRTVTITTEPNITGVASVDITLTVTDNGSPAQSADLTFTVNIRPTPERVYTNSQKITIGDNTIASPYPSTINVTDLQGNVARVAVTLNGFKHEFPDDVDMLLTGPGGQKVILMSDAGGTASTGAAGLVFKFDQEGADGEIPDNGPLAAGKTYKPKNYEAAADSFPGAPAGAISDSLDVFKNQTAIGAWSLYIVDDTASDAGEVTSGWSLTITTQPSVSTLANQTVKEDNAAVQNFSVVQETFIQSPSLTFAGKSSNTALIADANITVQNLGNNNYQIRAQPNANATGTAEITLTITNQDGQALTTKYTVTVEPVNDVPRITEIADQVITAGSPAPARIAFNYSDVETDKKDLILTVVSSDPALIPNSNVTVVGNELLIVPAGTATGTATITITVKEPGAAGQTSEARTFKVTVAPAIKSTAAANLAAIPILDNQVNSSVINVRGVAGKITKVTVTLIGINHTFPDDIDLLLVGPGTNPKKVVLMGYAGGDGDLANARLTFDQDAADFPPDNSQISSPASYKPKTYQPNSFPGAPAGPYEAVLTAFNGGLPDGDWTLYAGDHASPDQGSISGGWILNITTTAPAISEIANQFLAEDTAQTISFQIADSDTALAGLTPVITQSSPELLVITQGGAGEARTLTLTPKANVFGPGSVTLTLTDGTDTATRTFNYSISGSNDDPVISGLANATTPENKPLAAAFTVQDIESGDGASLVATASVGNPAHGTAAVTSGAGGSRTLTFTPAAGSRGATAKVTVSVTDGSATVSQTIDVAITTPIGPAIAPIANRAVNEDSGPVVVDYSITGSSTENPTVTAQFSNPALISGVTVSGGKATIALVPNAFGTSEVTLTATDAFGSASSKFMLTVNPVADGPVLSAIADLSAPEDQTITVPLAISDPDSLAGDIILSGTFSNPGLISGVTFVQTASGASAQITPVANQTGVSVITITAADETGLTSSRTFALQINPVDDAPSLAPIPPQTTQEDTAITIALSPSDLDTPLSGLTFAGASDNPALVKSISIVNNGTTVLAMVTVVENATGTANITITARDGSSAGSQTFPLAVTPVNDSPTLAVIPDLIAQEDASFAVSLNLTDVDTKIEDLVLTATSDNPAVVSRVSFSNDRTEVFASFSLVKDATGIANIFLTVSDGTTELARSFKVTVQPVDDAPVLAIADQTVQEDGTAVININVTDVDTALSGITLTGSSANTALVSGVTIANNGTAATATVTLVKDATGTARVTITAKDAVSTVAQTFNLVIQPVDDAPVLVNVRDLTAKENESFAVRLDITDVDTAIEDLVLTATSDNTAVVSKVSFSNDGTDIFASFTLVKDANGIANIFLTVSDGTTDLARAFKVTVQPVDDAPVLVIADQTVQEDGTAVVTINISDADTDLSGITLTGASADTALVSGVTIARTATGATATVTLVKDATGTARVTITAKDAVSTVSQTFNLVIQPVDDAPVLAVIQDVNTQPNTPATIKVNISDIDTNLRDLVFTASSGNTAVVSGVTFANDGTTVTATFNLVKDATGTANIFLTATDGTTDLARSFNVIVAPVANVAATLAIAKDGNSIRITLTGSKNAAYAIEGTADFRTWTAVRTVTTDANGTAAFNVEPTSPLRFYRAK